MLRFILLALCYVAVSAVPLDAGKGMSRIVGGSITSIDNYPSIVAILEAWDRVNFEQSCGGTILNQRFILSAAHCFMLQFRSLYRGRVGSSMSSSGGVVHNIDVLIMHPNYNSFTFDSDIAVLRTASSISYSNVVQPGVVAGPNYDLRDNEVVWAAGWGAIQHGGSFSPELRHVQIWTVNQDICRERYGVRLTDNMLCSGVLDVGGRDQCSGDSGGPLYHFGTVVGVCSFGEGCALPRYPGINARVTRFSNWIQATARL